VARTRYAPHLAGVRALLALPTSDAPTLPSLTEQERRARLPHHRHPTGPQIMRFYRADLDVAACSPLPRLGATHGATVRIAGAIVVKQHPETAKGHVFLSSRTTGMSNVIIRLATYRKHKRVLDANAAVVERDAQLVDGFGTRGTTRWARSVHEDRRSQSGSDRSLRCGIGRRSKR
jgi:hypothetical protein